MTQDEKREQERKKLLDFGKHLSNEQLDQFIDLKETNDPYYHVPLRMSKGIKKQYNVIYEQIGETK